MNENIETHVTKEKINQNEKQDKQFVSLIDKNLGFEYSLTSISAVHVCFCCKDNKNQWGVHPNHTYSLPISSYKSVLKLGILAFYGYKGMIRIHIFQHTLP